MKEKINTFYNKNYKKILIIPALLIILSLAYIGYFYSQTGDFIKKDVTLTGGTTITFQSSISVQEMQNLLSKDFPDVSIVSLSDNTGKQTGLIVTTPEAPEKIKPALEKILNSTLTEQNSSVEFSGSSLSKDFFNQLLRAMLFAFILMGLVVFFVFGESLRAKVICGILTLTAARLTFPSSTFLGAVILIAAVILFFYGLYVAKEKKFYLYTLATFVFFLIFFFIPVYILILPITILLLIIYTMLSVPSIAVILAAFADILITVAIVNLFGMKISSAGIVAFLMLVGYSVDTDILLTTRVLRRKQESVNSSIFSAFKTGITMTLTSIIAVSIALFLVYRYETVLNQIFTIIIIGLFLDIFNTWITNASIIKWFVEKNIK